MSRITTALAILLLTATAAAELHIIDPQGGPGGTALQQVINAAQDGDVILLRDGDYTTSNNGYFSFGNVGLTIMGEAGFRPLLHRVDVLQLGAGRRLIFRGIDIIGSNSAGTAVPALRGLHCNGDLVLEDCTLRGGDGHLGTFGVPLHGSSGIELLGCHSTTLVRCDISGGDGFDDAPGSPVTGTPGGTAVLASHSDVAIQDCLLQGGAAGSGLTVSGFPVDGGHGLHIEALPPGGSLILISGSTATGGNASPDGGRAGHGLLVQDPDATVWRRRSNLHGGTASGSGTPGMPLSVESGTVIPLPASHRSLELSSTLPSGGTAHLLIDGEPGDLVLAAVGQPGGFVPLLGEQGVLALPLAGLAYPLVIGTLPAPDGVLTLDFDVPELDVGMGGVLFGVQGVFFGSNGARLGDSSVAVWIEGGL